MPSPVPISFSPHIRAIVKVLIATVLSAAIVAPGAVQAMTIQQFDKMAAQDRSDFVADLVVGAQKVLIDEGKSDLATHVQKLFTETPSGDEAPLGMTEFERNLAILRVADAKNAAAHPNDPRVEVEDAMALTLKKNGVDLPQSFFDVNKDFKPKHTQDKKN